MLEGDCIYLRPFEKEDIEILTHITAAQQSPSMFFLLSLSVSDYQSWLVHYLKDNTTEFFVIECKKTRKEAGVIGLSKISHRNHNAELGAIFLEDWKEKIGREAIDLILEYAFIDLGSNRIYGYGCASVAEFGFSREAVLSEAYYDGEKYSDMMISSILQKEWRLDRDFSRY